jgi:hypothetical protein
MDGDITPEDSTKFRPSARGGKVDKPLRVPGIDSDPDIFCPACGDETNVRGLCPDCRSAIERGLGQRESRSFLSAVERNLAGMRRIGQ